MGAAIAATLLYLVILRGSSDPGERVTGNRVAVTLSEFKIVPRSSDQKATPLLSISSMRPGETHSNGAVLAPGKYRWRSSISNDDDLGMYGVIEVRQ